MFNQHRQYRGLGNDISDATSLGEAIKRSGLTWKVQEIAPEIPIKRESGSSNHIAKEWKALVRHDKSAPDGIRVLDIVTKGYQVIQNDEIMDIFREVAHIGNMKLQTAGTIHGGERIFAIAKLDGEFHFPGVSDRKRIDHGGPGKVEMDDSTHLKILMGSGHCSGIPLTFDVIAERQICTNGAVITAEAGRLRFVHKRELTEGDRAKVVEFIERAKYAFEKYKQKAEILRGSNFSDEVNRAFVVELLQPNLLTDVLEHSEAVFEHGRRFKKGNDQENTLQKGKLMLDFILNEEKYKIKMEDLSLPSRQVLHSITNQPGADMAEGTAWNTYNAVTYYVDHQRGRTSDNGLENAMYGNGVKMKAGALELAVEYTQRLATM